MAITPRPLTRRETLSLLTAFATQLGLSGCAATSTPSASTPTNPVLTNPQPTPPGLIVASNVTVGTTAKGTAAQGFCGLSYEKSAISRRTLTTTSAGLVKLFQLLNAKSVLRVGGNSVDSTTYSPTAPGSTLGSLANSDIAAFTTFVQAVNYGVIYGINLKGFLASPPTQTVANAVAEATYAASVLGANLLEFEIGNEPDLYTTTLGANYTYAQFAAIWEPVATAIHAALPTIPISGPAIASTGNISSWSVPFASAEKSRGLNLLTQHRYVASGTSASATDATLLADSSNTGLAQSMQTLNTTATAQGMTWRMSETGTYYAPTSGTGQQAYDFASALWVIDFLFTNIVNGGQGINLHSGGLPQYSPYVPLNDDEINTVTSVNAVFYGMLLFALGGAGTAVQTTISSSVNATAYSIMVDATHISTWIINKDTTSSQNLQVAITLPITVKSATLKVMTNTSLSAHTGTTIQGATIGVDGSFNPAADYTLSIVGTTVTCYVPYNSAVLVQTILN